MDHERLRSAQVRLNKELLEITEKPPPGVSACLVDDNNLFEWQATLFGPDNTPYAGGIFQIGLTFTGNYPTEAPKAKFLCDMFHPNIYRDGRVCIDILGGKWKPTYTPSMILYVILVMLSNPNPNSPANPDAKNLFLCDSDKFCQKVKETLNLKLA